MVTFLPIGHRNEENQQRIGTFIKKNKPVLIMNEEIRCITNEGKTAKNEWKNNSNFLPPLHIVYKKLVHFFFHTLLANLFKQRYISSVTSYKY